MLEDEKDQAFIDALHTKEHLDRIQKELTDAPSVATVTAHSLALRRYLEALADYYDAELGLLLTRVERLEAACGLVSKEPGEPGGGPRIVLLRGRKTEDAKGSNDGPAPPEKPSGGGGPRKKR